MQAGVVVSRIVEIRHVRPAEEDGGDAEADEEAGKDTDGDDTGPLRDEVGPGVAEEGEGGELGNVGKPRGLDDDHVMVGRDALVGEYQENGEEETETDKGLDVTEDEDRVG